MRPLFVGGIRIIPVLLTYAGMIGIHQIDKYVQFCEGLVGAAAVASEPT